MCVCVCVCVREPVWRNGYCRQATVSMSQIQILNKAFWVSLSTTAP